jgi:hypothetical protein
MGTSKQQLVPNVLIGSALYVDRLKWWGRMGRRYREALFLGENDERQESHLTSKQ